MTKLLGWGVAFPPHEYTNDELGRLLALPPDKPARYGRLLGIERRRCSYDFRTKRQTIPCDQLASSAAAEAIRAADIAVSDIDAVIATSSCFDYLFPSISSRVLKSLGLPHALTFDLMGGCAEFLHGVALADLLLETGRAVCVLVIAAEVITSLNLQVRYPVEYFIFGDAGGAVVLTRDQGNFELVRSWLDTRSHFEGESLDPVIAPLLGGKAPGPLFSTCTDTSPLVGNTVRPEYRLVHDGRMAMRIAAPLMAEAVEHVIGPEGLTAEDYFLVPHQPGVPVLLALGEVLGLPLDQLGISSAHRGNMSTASVPVAFADHIERIRQYRYHVWASIGAGVSFGAMLWERCGSGPSRMATDLAVGP